MVLNKVISFVLFACFSIVLGGCRLTPDEMARKFEIEDVRVFDREMDKIASMKDSPRRVSRFHEVQLGLVLVDFNRCEQEVKRFRGDQARSFTTGRVVSWRERMVRLLHSAAGSSMPAEEVEDMIAVYRARVAAETHPWASGFLKWYLDEISQEVAGRLAARIEREVFSADLVARKLEAEEWQSFDRAYHEVCGEENIVSLRKGLLSFQKRALLVDFEKMERRIRREWAKKATDGDGLSADESVQAECDRALSRAYDRLGKLSSDICARLVPRWGYSKEIWNVWFDYIEKMETENDRRKRDRLKGCEEAIRQIESLRSRCYVSDCVSEIEKDVDEWLHEKFLRLVGRPMANGK